MTNPDLKRGFSPLVEILRVELHFGTLCAIFLFVFEKIQFSVQIPHFNNKCNADENCQNCNLVSKYRRYQVTILTIFQGRSNWRGGGGTVLSFGRSLAENCGGLGLSETMSKSIFGPNLIIFWYLE